MSKSLRQRLGVAVTGLAVASAGLAMTAVVAPSASAAEQPVAVSNGNFEQPKLSTDAYAFSNYSAADADVIGLNGQGWAVTSGDVELVNDLVWNGHGGGQSLDLNGNGPGEVCQVIPTGPGFDYVVDFWMSRNGAGGSSSATLTASATDSAQVSTSVQATHSGPWLPTAPAWQAEQLTFAATGPSTTLCFTSDVPTGGHGPVIDDVTVTKLNEVPVITITNPTDGEDFYVGQDSQFEFSCVDPDGDEVALSSVIVDHQTDDEYAVESGDDIPTFAPGRFTLEVSCSDGQSEVSEEASADYQVLTTVAGCRATSVQLLGLKLADANPALIPCATKAASVVDTTKILGAPGPLQPLNSVVALKAIRADTYRAHGYALATSSVGEVRLRVPIVNLDITARAIKSRVDSGVPDDCGIQTIPTSTVASVEINGKVTLIGSDPMNITLPGGLGVIRANQVIVNGNGTTTVRALHIDLVGTALDVIVAESTAGIACVPLPSLPT
jgi:hypothetical protein